MNRRFALLTVSLALFPASAFALATDPLIEGAKLCTRHLPRYEQAMGIPTHLLSAIASSESGRYHNGLKIAIPWPWTINAEGKGAFFNNKQEAVAAVRKLQAQGVKSIDVGCMQVNLMHHPRAFSSLDQAFEPENNIAYAANFLKGLYEEGRSWKKAASDYHSRTPSRGAQYLSTVYGKWRNIIDKVQAARLQSGPGLAAAKQEAQSVTSAQQVASLMPLPPAQKTQQKLPEQAGKAVPQRQKPHMRVIEISKPTQTNENGVTVVRTAAAQPDAAKPEQKWATLEAAKPIPGAIPIPNAKVIKVAKVSARAKGPTFIFQD